MRNIILQHFTGELRELDKLSSANIANYASRIGAEYELLRGQVFREHLTPPCQKVAILNEKFDCYDEVLMLDIDVFAAARTVENVFEVPGIGIKQSDRRRPPRARLERRGVISSDTPYWGGQFYKMSRPVRIALRDQMPEQDEWMDPYNVPYNNEDEGILSELSFKAGFKEDRETYVDPKWCQCSFLPDQKKAKMIHVRTKIGPKGPKRTKMENYLDLVEKGIIQ